MGMYVADAARMEDFYTRMLGFAVTDRGNLGSTKLVFLSRDPGEHHQIILASGRPDGGGFNPINQISFRMAEFAGLREMHRRLAAGKVRDLSPVSHGNALSLYFLDPEGNRLELFVDTPWYCRQPMRIPVNMDLDDKALWAWAEAEARKQPDFMPVGEWRAKLARRMQV